MSWLVTISKLISPDYRSLAKSSNSIQFVSIGLSHYCDFAAWCLKVQGFKVEEYQYAPVRHIFGALALRVGGSTRHLSNTSRTTDVQLPDLSPEDMAKKTAKEIRKDKAARSTAVPVAICPKGVVWTDSWDIATKAGLKEIDPELKKVLDEDIGPLSRQLAYHYILQPRNDAIFNQLLTLNTNFFWKFLWWLFLGAYAKKILVKAMQPYHAGALAECRAKLEVALKFVDQRVASKTTPFLSGSSIGTADIAVAALVGPLINHPKYCEGRYAHLFEKLMQQDDELRAEVLRVRATPTGEFAMMMYEKYR